MTKDKFEMLGEIYTSGLSAGLKQPDNLIKFDPQFEKKTVDFDTHAKDFGDLVRNYVKGKAKDLELGTKPELAKPLFTVDLVKFWEGKAVDGVPAEAPVVHAAIATEAGKLLAEAENEEKRQTEKLAETAKAASATESDQVKIARIQAEVEELKSARAHVEALRKIESDERIASLGLEIKRLEGENQRQLADLNNASARAVAAEAQVSQLKLEQEKNKGAVVVQTKTSRTAIITAVCTTMGVIASAAITSCVKDKAASGSAQSQTTPAAKPAQKCGLRILRISGIKSPEKIAFRLSLGNEDVPQQHAWLAVSEASQSGVVDLPSCSGSLKPQLYVGDAAQGTLEKNPQQFQEELAFHAGEKATFDLGHIGEPGETAILEYEVLKL